MVIEQDLWCKKCNAQRLHIRLKNCKWQCLTCLHIMGHNRHGLNQCSICGKMIEGSLKGQVMRQHKRNTHGI